MVSELLNKTEVSDKLTNRDVLNHCTRLENLSDVPTFALNKAVSKNIKALLPIKKAYDFSKFVKKTTEYLEYEKELNEAYRKLATPEGSNAPKTKVIPTANGDNVILDIDFNSDEVKAIRNEIESKYAEALKIREAQLIAYGEWLDEPCTDPYELYYITEDDMPKTDGNFKDLWDALRFVIK